MMKMELSIENLLNFAWVASIMPILIASFPSSHLNSFHHTVVVFSGRGKTFQASSRLSKLTVPQSFFSHFYVLAAVWTSVLLLTTWVYAHNIGLLVSESTFHSNIASYLAGGSHILSFHKTYSTSREHIFRVWRSVFLLILMEVQVLYRLYESLYVFNYSSTARMNIFGYLTGLFFYTAAPLSLSCNCAPEVFTFAVNRVAEFIVKGKNRMPPPEFQWLEYLSPLLKLDWLQWIGAIIFFYGWLHQRRCHAILGDYPTEVLRYLHSALVFMLILPALKGNLREEKEHANDYQVPHGDWFKSVSCPHYLAEIVIYAGLLVASGGHGLPVWLLFTFVVANLVFAAAETHRWYQRKFDNYPSNRYAIIPFLY